MRRLSIFAWLTVSMAMLLTACGGDSSSIIGESGTASTGGSTTTGGTTTKLSMGSGTGSTFQSGVLAVSTTSLSAGGSSSLQVSIVDQTGALYTTPTAVTFSSPCQAQGLATITATGSSPAGPSITTSTGSASATYAATGCSASDVITATASANGQNLTATGTVTVAQAAIGSISFISATPTTISLKGVGSVGGSATSTVVFKVLDTSGGPRAGATVTMSLNSSVGGITLAPTSATTDANGQVQTVVSGGTVATTVRVTATTQTSAGASISTESNSLTVSTGIPTSHNISLAVGSETASPVICPNVEAWDIDGVTVPVTVSMTDRFSNPVPDGTTANFQTTLGGIQPSCQTKGGTCSVNWTSKAPYSISGNPQSTSGNANANTAYCPGAGPVNLCNGTTNGRSPIMVSAIGEESFIDANGSGVFNPADTVPFNANNPQNNFANGTPKPWDDTSEPFLNEWELGTSYANGTVFVPTYVLGEPFIDFNNNGTRDGPDNLVESALCEGPLCNTTEASVAIYAGDVIIASTSGANFYTSGSVPSLSTGGTFSLRITDQHYQQMPGGTTVTYSVSPTTATTVVTPTNYAWPCSTAVGGQVITFTTTAGTAPSAGNLIITVTTPGKIATTASFPFT